MGGEMLRIGWILIGLMLVMVPSSFAQTDSDAGAFSGGFYGSGGRSGAAGAYLGIYDTKDFEKPTSFKKLMSPGFFLELGMIGPIRKSPIDGVFAFNAQSTYNLRRGGKWRGEGKTFLFLNGGYSRFFVNGNGADYGGGILCRHDRQGDSRGKFNEFRIEYREFYLPGWGRQPGFRLSIGSTDF
jgi:hypothetical protein